MRETREQLGKAVPFKQVLKKYLCTWNALGCAIALGVSLGDLNYFRKKVSASSAEPPASPVMPVKPASQR